MNYKVLLAATLAASVVQAGTIEDTLPKPWFKNGAAPAVEKCQAGVDEDLAKLGTPNVTLKCETNEEGFVSFMQQFSAEDYRGNNVRFSADVKAEGVEGWGGLWMRVDNVNKKVAAFDNMQNRPIKDTSDWRRYSIVLSVSPDDEVVSIGMLLNGRGQMWVKSMSVEVVTADVPVTDLGAGRLLDRPTNLELQP